MLGQVMKNSALYAKIHAMVGKTLKEKDYFEMLNMKTVPEVASYLAENTSYGDVLKNISLNDIHRATLEQILRDNLNSDCKRVAPFMSEGAKKFMKILTVEEDVFNIKICLRLIHMGNFENLDLYMKKIAGIATVPEITSIDDFIDFLKDTPCYDGLKRFYENPEKQFPFYMETELDTQWANLLFKYAKKYLDDNDRKNVLKIFGVEIDLDNLTYLLRCKKTFDMSDDEIYASIIPKYYKLKESTISEIVKASSVESAIEIVKNETPYGEAFSGDDRFFEKRVEEYLLKKLKRMYSASGYSSYLPICYLRMRRKEIDNIISIIEGIRYGLEVDKISTYLIGYTRGGRTV